MHGGVRQLAIEASIVSQEAPMAKGKDKGRKEVKKPKKDKK